MGSPGSSFCPRSDVTQCLSKGRHLVCVLDFSKTSVSNRFIIDSHYTPLILLIAMCRSRGLRFTHGVPQYFAYAHTFTLVMTSHLFQVFDFSPSTSPRYLLLEVIQKEGRDRRRSPGPPHRPSREPSPTTDPG